MKFLFVFALCFLFSACSVNERIIDSETGIVVAGYCKNCEFPIGSHPKNGLTAEQIKQYKKDGLMFSFANPPSEGIQKSKILAVGFTSKYRTSKGLEIGDSKLKALQLYGKPRATFLDYGRDEQHRIYFTYQGLFYKKMSIITDRADTIVTSINIGPGVKKDNKHIVK